MIEIQDKQNGFEEDDTQKKKMEQITKIEFYKYCKKHKNTFFPALLSQGCKDCEKLNKRN